MLELDASLEDVISVMSFRFFFWKTISYLQNIYYFGDPANCKITVLKLINSKIYSKSVWSLQNFSWRGWAEISLTGPGMHENSLNSATRWAPLEACDHKESERKRHRIVENDRTMSTFTQDSMHQMALFESAVWCRYIMQMRELLIKGFSHGKWVQRPHCSISSLLFDDTVGRKWYL